MTAPLSVRCQANVSATDTRKLNEFRHLTPNVSNVSLLRG